VHRATQTIFRRSVEGKGQGKEGGNFEKNQVLCSARASSSASLTLSPHCYTSLSENPSVVISVL
jgi:hypothetical protein